VPVSFASVVGPRLEAHGVAFKPLAQGQAAVRAGTFRAQQVRFSSTPFEGRMRAQLEGAWSEQAVNIEAGALVRSDCPTVGSTGRRPVRAASARLVCCVGLLNACFEQKEQMEPYVAEQIAAGMLAADAGLRETVQCEA